MSISWRDNSMLKKILVSLGLMLSLLSCRDNKVSPIWTPPFATEISPPPDIYRIWWQDIENCSHLTGNFNNITFYLVPGIHFNCSPEGDIFQCVGLWQAKPKSYIYIASVFAVSPQVVEHEMLHELEHKDSVTLLTPHDSLFTKCVPES